MEQSYIEAINGALRQEMRRDPSVYVFGEDVAVGGPFGATKELAKEFGERRVVNTPISEGTVLGLATGAAILGIRPVVEIMFMDFLPLALDQIVNEAAKYHYMSGGQFKVPMVIRTQGGAVGGWGPHHSQSLEAWLLHIPGLKVVAPSLPADGKGLLSAAIRDDNPVVFIEHRGLYFARGEAPDEEYILPLGSATVRRSGADVTLLAYSNMVRTALHAADLLASGGIEAEVVDLRSLSPLDMDTVSRSVKKTHRAVVAHEAVVPGGVGAELAAQIQEALFDYLDAPVARIGAPFTPVPSSPVLERQFVPGADKVVDRVKRLLGK